MYDRVQHHFYFYETILRVRDGQQTMRSLRGNPDIVGELYLDGASSPRT